MTFWDFANQHIFFCFFSLFLILAVIDGIFVNYFRYKLKKGDK